MSKGVKNVNREKTRNLVCGVGVYEKGKHLASVNGKHTKVYTAWHSMLKRCYSEKALKRHPTYTGCSVCDDWIYFQRFAEWYKNNYYGIEGSKLQLDKDLLFKDNKVYSPETCMYVPHWLNMFTVACNVARGKYPLGVNYKKQNKKYQANCKANGKKKYIEYFSTPEEAHQAYINFKISLIPDMLLRLKEEKIPSSVYAKIESALYSYDFSR